MPPGPITQRAAFAHRQSRLLAAMKARGLERAVLAAGFARPRNFAHNVFPFRAESPFLYLVGRHLEGALWSVADGVSTLYVPEPDPASVVWLGAQSSPEELEAELEMRVRPLEEFEPAEAVATLPPQDAETATWLTSHVGRDVEAQSGPWLEGIDAQLADALVEVRLIHDEAALEQLRHAAEVSSSAHRVGMAKTRACRFEFEVRAEVEAQMARFGLSPAYSSIVTLHGEVLHNMSSRGALVDGGPLLLCDAGAETWEGFAGDITRTWPVSGRFTGAAGEVYRAVLSVQLSVLGLVRAGVSFLELHRHSCLKMAEELVGLGWLKGEPSELVMSGATAVFYPHGLGHLLGLDVHDMEDLGDRAGYEPGVARDEHPAFAALRLERELRSDMVVTIEPGLYLSPALLGAARSDRRIREQIHWPALERVAGLGGVRIEDDVRVKEGGCEVLSAEAPKSPADIEAMMRA